MSSDAATHENQQVALPPQSLNLYSKDTRTARAALINFFAEPDDDEVLPPQRCASTLKRAAAKANIEKKVAYPLRPTRTQSKLAAASSEQAPRPASNPANSSLEKENAPTSPRQVLPRVSASGEQHERTTGVEGHRPTGFLTIPPEIRNQIHDLVATPKVGVVNLLFARVPTKALPRLCRQVFNEVRFLHKAAHRSYWRDTQFIIRPRATTRIKKCTSADVANIRHIHLEVKEDDSTAVYERRANRNWYKLTLDGVLPGSFYTRFPVGTEVEWQELTIEELNSMFSHRYSCERY
ncbi:hypothetical protein LTR97_008322 [Elasticomyces elasticus]|uniref:Uncharacterized protein n=1 Tax=Elasticomyces elasticus TaxID=574655 RepID=A0AAN7W1I4_9PEZI|nr:hypothetical protein LTR97_008322 [Elasticomyces elasticus]